jgi:integrase
MSKTSKTAKLTKELVAKATPGDSPQLLIRDSVTKGFGLRVSRRKKSYIVQGRVAGTKQQPRITLSSLDENGKPLTLPAARKMAQIYLGQMKAGTNPSPSAQQHTETPTGDYTLQQAWEDYREALEKEKCRPNTLISYQRPVKYIADWMDKPLASITRPMVNKRHTKIRDDVKNGYRGGKETSGENTANSVIRFVRTIYNYAIEEVDNDLPQNPVRKFTFYKEVPKRAAIPPTELPTWWQDVHALSNHIRRDALFLALFTGLRKTNVLEVQWDHVDFKAATLHMPVTKSGEPFTLPLSDFLVELLESRKAENKKLHPKSPWVFPSDRGTGHFTKMVNREKEEFRVEFTALWLRHTFVTVAGDVVPNWLHVKLLVNHAKPNDDMTARYSHPTTEDLRVAMQMVTDRLMQLCNPAPVNRKVIPIKKRKQA